MRRDRAVPRPLFRNGFLAIERIDGVYRLTTPVSSARRSKAAAISARV